MAGSMYAYVRNFELPDPILPNTFMVVRIDGKGFHKFSEAHRFVKPNDGRALELMNEAARHVMLSLRPDIILAFGESDEYSFVFRTSCTLYKRRLSKIVTHVVSLFTSAYVFKWQTYLPNVPLQYPPSFDGRLVAYPSQKELRDYLSWRQVDTHINNLYNTTFWALVQSAGQSERQAHGTLQGTVSSEKHEILYDRFSINYDKLPAMFRKGTTLVWDAISSSKPSESSLDASSCNSSSINTSNGTSKEKVKMRLRTLHVDLIGKTFWSERRSDVIMPPQPEHDVMDTESSQPWEHVSRTSNTAGLGAYALTL